MDAELHRRDGDGRVHVVWRGHRDRIDVALFALKHLAPVGVASNLGHIPAKLLEFRESRIHHQGIHVAEGNYLCAGGIELRPVVHPLSADPDDAEADFLPRRNDLGGLADEKTPASACRNCGGQGKTFQKRTTIE